MDINIVEINWHDTQVYKFTQEENEGYHFGIAQWYGEEDNLEDTLIETEIEWQWFKTEEERDLSVKELSASNLSAKELSDVK